MVDLDLELGVGEGDVSFVGPGGFLALMAFLPLVVFSFLPNIRLLRFFSCVGA